MQSLSDPSMLTLIVDIFRVIIVQFQKISTPPPQKGLFLIPLLPLLENFQSSFVHFFKYFSLTEPSLIPKKFQSLLWEDVRIFSGLVSTLPVAGRDNPHTRSTLITDIQEQQLIKSSNKNAVLIILQ